MVFVLAFCGCDSTRSLERKAERERREAEESRMRAAFLGRIHEAEASVWEILHPLMKQAANYRAEETFGYTGAVFVSQDFYSEALLKEAVAEGFGPFVSVLTVFPGSPAERAGLRAGDQLVSVNGVKAPKGPRAATFAARRIKRLLEPGKPNDLVIAREEEILTLQVEPVEGAYYAVVIVASNSVDLHVDGDVIWIGLALVESMDRRDELAYLGAYALAKNVMRHPEQKGKNTFLGQILDIAAMAGGVNTGGIFGGMAGNAYSHAFEVEADLIALYLLASSGYRIDSYPDFWDEALRRQSRKGELTANDAERLEVMERVIAAIEEKAEAGEAIYPEAYLQGDVSEIK